MVVRLPTASMSLTLKSASSVLKWRRAWRKSKRSSAIRGWDYYVVADGDNAPSLNWAIDLDSASDDASRDNPPDTVETTIGETAFYIFTSGTTGLPKAAVLSNRRYLISADMAAIAGFKATEQDRLCICLPLYHGTGLMIGVGAVIASGASMFVRRKFSASNFLSEVREQECTVSISATLSVFGEHARTAR